jgi:DNA-binding beta-propeller fold protein YncE
MDGRRRLAFLDRSRESRHVSARKVVDMNCATALLMTVATASALMTAHPRAAIEPDPPMLPYHFVARPAPPPGTEFDNIASVVLTADNHLIALNRNPDRAMIEYDQNNKFIRSFNPNIARTPHGMRIDRFGNIWVIDSFMNVIMKLNAKGEPIATYGVRGENAPWDDTKWNGMFNQPLDVNWDRDDNFYVVQSHGGTSPPKSCTFCATYDSEQVRSQLQQSGQRAALVSNPPADPGSDPRVLKFDKNGRYITSYSLKHGDGSPATIHSVIVSPQREVWVTDRQVKKIYVFDENLKFKREIQETYLTCGLFVDSQGGLWMSAGADGLIAKLDWSGKVLGRIGKQGSNPDSNEIGEAHYLTVTPDLKTIYVADTVSNHILKLEHN